MTGYASLGPGKKAPRIVNVVVEVPKGSSNKYELDMKLGLLRLDRVLFSPLRFPADYGVIPGTRSGDGDALDALVLGANPSLPGTLLEAKPIGLFRMTDSGKGDHKVLCVPLADSRLAHYNDIKDVPKHMLDAIVHFFEVYKELEDKPIRILGWAGADEALKAIKDSMRLVKR